MKKCWLLFLVLSCTFLAQSKDWTQYVNPLMGTQSSFELSTGNTYPAIARPWGMNFWTPQTGKMGDGWQYVYTDNKIRGFKQTHQPSPWINDYGQFSIMPMVGKPEFDEEKRASWFGHKGEEATPYYYKVYLAEYDIVTEMSRPNVLFSSGSLSRKTHIRILQSMHLTKVLLFRLSQKKTKLSVIVHAIAEEFPKTSRTISLFNSISLSPIKPL